MSFQNISQILVSDNFVYKNNKLFFIFKNPKKLNINGVNKYIKEYLIDNKSLKAGPIYYMGIPVYSEILPIEFENKIKIKIQFNNKFNSFNGNFLDIKKLIESSIIGLQLEDNNEDITDDNLYNDKYIFNTDYDYETECSSDYDEISEIDNFV